MSMNAPSRLRPLVVVLATAGVAVSVVAAVLHAGSVTPRFPTDEELVDRTALPTGGADDPATRADVTATVAVPLVFKGVARRTMVREVLNLACGTQEVQDADPEAWGRVMTGAYVLTSFHRTVRLAVGGRELAVQQVLVGFPSITILVQTEDGAEYELRRPAVRSLARLQHAMGAGTSAAYEWYEGSDAPDLSGD